MNSKVIKFSYFTNATKTFPDERVLASSPLVLFLQLPSKGNSVDK